MKQLELSNFAAINMHAIAMHFKSCRAIERPVAKTRSRSCTARNGTEASSCKTVRVVQRKSTIISRILELIHLWCSENVHVESPSDRFVQCWCTLSAYGPNSSPKTRCSSACHADGGLKDPMKSTGSSAQTPAPMSTLTPAPTPGLDNRFSTDPPGRETTVVAFILANAPIALHQSHQQLNAFGVMADKLWQNIMAKYHINYFCFTFFFHERKSQSDLITRLG